MLGIMIRSKITDPRLSLSRVWGKEAQSFLVEHDERRKVLRNKTTSSGRETSDLLGEHAGKTR